MEISLSIAIVVFLGYLWSKLNKIHAEVKEIKANMLTEYSFLSPSELFDRKTSPED